MKRLRSCLLRIYFLFSLNLLRFVVNEETHVNDFVPACLFLICVLGAMFSNVSLITDCYTAEGNIVILSSVTGTICYLILPYVVMLLHKVTVESEFPVALMVIHFEGKVSRKPC